MSLLRTAALTCAAVAAAVPAAADPVRWPQPSGPGTGIVITYSYSNLDDGGFNSTLTTGEVRGLTTWAFGIWARYAPLTFFEVPDSGPPPTEMEYASGSSDIRIGYLPGLPGGHAAHAHLPYERRGVAAGGLAGDIHLSNDTRASGAARWGEGAIDPLALDFFSVILHEIGHSLGIPHLAGDAVMGTTLLLFGHPELADLRPADIAALRALYGSGTGSVAPLGPDSLPTPEPGTLLLFGSGIALTVWRRSRRRPGPPQSLPWGPHHPAD